MIKILDENRKNELSNEFIKFLDEIGANNIDKTIKNDKLKKHFEEETITKKLYHKTDCESAKKIEEEGFKIPNFSNYSQAGKGIYFAYKQNNAIIANLERDKDNNSKCLIEVELPDKLKMCHTKIEYMFKAEKNKEDYLFGGLYIPETNFNDMAKINEAYAEKGRKNFFVKEILKNHYGNNWKEHINDNYSNDVKDEIRKFYNDTVSWYSEFLLDNGCQALNDYVELVIYDKEILKNLKIDKITEIK